MDLKPKVFLIIGSLLIAALFLDTLGQRSRLPRVTLLMLFGLLIGKSGLNLLPEEASLLFPYIAEMALTMVCFLLGGYFTRAFLQRSGWLVLNVSIGKVIGSAVFVSLAFLLAGSGWQLALLLAAISTATAPAATLDVVKSSHRKNRFTKTLLAVVALDDLWGLLVFSLCLSVVAVGVGEGSAFSLVARGVWEVVGAIIIGALLGLPTAYLSGRIVRGEPTQLEALGLVFLCAGAAMLAQVSFLLTAMVLGAVVANVATHHTRAFHEIETFDRPFLVLFFVLAGATLPMDQSLRAGGMAVVYVLFRVVGTWLGSWLAAYRLGEPPVVSRWLGVALLPQAGVAIGMALIAAQQYPQWSSDILTVAIASTVFFELFGPVCTRYAISKAHPCPSK